jgi:hypothetical protein
MQRTLRFAAIFGFGDRRQWSSVAKFFTSIAARKWLASKADIPILVQSDRTLELTVFLRRQVVKRGFRTASHHWPVSAKEKPAQYLVLSSIRAHIKSCWIEKHGLAATFAAIFFRISIVNACAVWRRILSHLVPGMPSTLTAHVLAARAFGLTWAA